MAVASPIDALHRLARLYRVQVSYRDNKGRRHTAAPEVLLAVLQALGAPLATLREAPGALRERRQELVRQRCEPVVVAWDGGPCRVPLRPGPGAGGAARLLTCRLELETGEVRTWPVDPSDLPVLAGPGRGGGATPGGQREPCATRVLLLPGGLPPGYHRLSMDTGGEVLESLVIVAPRRAPAQPAAVGEGERCWGVFLPLYAAHSARSWGAGDLADLESMGAWVAGRGGRLVGTLPLLAAFLDQPFEPSPYAPASRLFWNEFYLDLLRIPELAACPEARERLGSPALQAALEELRPLPLVDYGRIMALKRPVLAAAARWFFATRPPRWAAFEAFRGARPDVEAYARFRAAGERFGRGWHGWPAPLQRSPASLAVPADEAFYYHLFVQWLMEEQLGEVTARLRARGAGLYLDMPVGVHPESFDTWWERDAFALHLSAGAPPDPFFHGGQDWGFPPLHPEGIRAGGYRYFAACLRQQLRHAAVLRLDHVMGLHRMFCLPRGARPTEGAYVRYRAGEFYAVLTLEAWRSGAVVVGEDLGTVPRYVRQAMARHGIQRLYVLQAELPPGAAAPTKVEAERLASLNTHDMPPFAGFWQGAGATDREERAMEREVLLSFLIREGWLAGLPAAAGSGGRQPGGATGEPPLEEILRAALAFLAASPARVLLVNLEDLWLETARQNVPGTGPDQEPNWRRKARYPLETWTVLPWVKELLETVDRHRRMAFVDRGDTPSL